MMSTSSHRVFKTYAMKFYFLGRVPYSPSINNASGIDRFRIIRTETTPITTNTESIVEFLNNINLETIVNAYSNKLTLLNVYREMRIEYGSIYYSHLMIK